jgi:hypothetical protein
MTTLIPSIMDSSPVSFLVPFGDLRMRGVQIRDDDPRTGIDERQHDRTAKAARSACHDRDSAVASRP